MNRSLSESKKNATSLYTICGLQGSLRSIIEDLRDRLARHPEVDSLTTKMILKTWCERISGIRETAPEGHVITRNGELVA